MPVKYYIIGPQKRSKMNISENEPSEVLPNVVCVKSVQKALIILNLACFEES